jgi:hypothetical protein
VALGSGNDIQTNWSGLILTSVDGVDWGSQKTTNSLVAAAYGNGQFVAVGSSSVSTSSDGLTWSQRNPPGLSGLSGVSYGNGRFVAVGGGWRGKTFNSQIWSSDDGVDWVETWSEAEHGTVAYGNGQFVADFVLNSMVTSTDGLHWVNLGFSGPGPINDLKHNPFLTYAHGQFFGLNSGCPPAGGPICPSTLLTSIDAVNWAGVSGLDFTSVEPQGVAYGNGQFVLVGMSGTLLNSADGTNWAPLMPPLPLNSITYGNGEFVAVGGTRGRASVLTSGNGVDWVERPCGATNLFDSGLQSVAYGNGQFVAVGGGMGSIMTSADGVNWLQSHPPAVDTPNAVAYGGGRFVDVTDSYLLSSADGVNWAAQEWSTAGAELSGITYGNGQFVAVGAQDDEFGQPASATILTSTNGVTWETWTSAKAYTLKSVTYGSRRFVAVGYDQRLSDIVLVSSDGVNWVESQPGSQSGLVSIAFGNGQFVAVGQVDSGFVMTSRDGVNWFQRGVGMHTSGLVAVAFGDGHFVALGNDGTILQSGPIINLSVTSGASTGLPLLSLEGPTGLDFTIQSSTDLNHWQDVTTITGSPSGKMVLDGLPIGPGNLFYRAQSQ